eukprot:c16507_g1_i1.p1 GENE.c16507_g1_i1~~c16507_g1_i1.p1  ORF type:complete len:408 (+),score=97.97 c16507_g1_i1:141-1226(+)
MPEALQTMDRSQKINRFPGSWQLSRKDMLSRQIRRMRNLHGDAFNLEPDTWILPEDHKALLKAMLAKNNPSPSSRLFISKPVADSCGRGIRVISSPNEIDLRKASVVQRYIANPFLVSDPGQPGPGFKFDLRLYVLVTSFTPLRAHFFHDGLVRFATKPFSTRPEDLSNRFVHLTNFSINKNAAGYKKDGDLPTKWNWKALQERMRSDGIDVSACNESINDLVVKTLLCVEPHISRLVKTFTAHKSSCFELYGFDVMLDDALRPWLIEVNISPSLATSSLLDKSIKMTLLEKVLSMVCDTDPNATDIEALKSEIEKGGEEFACIFPTKSSGKYLQYLEGTSAAENGAFIDALNATSSTVAK